MSSRDTGDRAEDEGDSGFGGSGTIGTGLVEGGIAHFGDLEVFL
jgi:hypothetical protein